MMDLHENLVVCGKLYSINSWIYCKLTNKMDDGGDNFGSNICSCKLEPYHSKKYSIQINHTEKTYKYPFKGVINVLPKLN